MVAGPPKAEVAAGVPAVTGNISISRSMPSNSRKSNKRDRR